MRQSFTYVLVLAAAVLSVPPIHAEVVTYVYDEPSSTYGKGRLTSVTDAAGTTRLFYDKAGRLTQTTKQIDGTSYQTTSRYDAVNRPTAVGYPDGSTVSYEYSSQTLTRVYEGSTNYAQYTGYNALGQPGSVTFGNGVVTSYTYANSGNQTCPANTFRLCTVATTKSGVPQPYQNLSYGYDAVGNVTGIGDGVNGSQSFSYDDVNRLQTATGPYGTGGAQATWTYAYNEIGNLTCNPQVSTCSAASPNYTYPASGTTSVRPHAVTQAGSVTYGYDANGSLTSGAGRAIAYDFQNRPVTIALAGATTTFVYDGDGGRVKKTVGGVTTTYIGQLYECSASCSKYIFAGSQRIALKPNGTSGTIYYYHGDHLGSSSAITDQNGAAVEYLSYLPFGSTRTDTGSLGVEHKYTGQRLDSSTGLYFYNARYYDPALGRFLQADTIVPSPSDPQSLNRYSYVRNNPILYTDPSGHSWLDRPRKWFRNVADDARASMHRNAALGTTLQMLPGTQALGTWMLTQSDQGRMVLAGEIVVVTAVATAYCGGCGAAPFLNGALIGEVTMGAVGGYSADQNGGDVSKGILFGVVVGGVTGGVGGGLGAYAEASIANQLAGYVVSGTIEGTFLGAGTGATAGYGGGVGNWETILTGTYRGALIGGATGAALGGARFGLRNVPRLDQLSSYDWATKLDQGVKGADAGNLLSLLRPFAPNIASSFVNTGWMAFGALSVGTGIELTNGVISEQLELLLRERLEDGVEYDRTINF